MLTPSGTSLYSDQVLGHPPQHQLPPLNPNPSLVMPPLESPSTADLDPTHFHCPYMPIPNHMGIHLPPSPCRWPPRLCFNTSDPKPKGTSLFVVDMGRTVLHLT